MAVGQAEAMRVAGAVESRHLTRYAMAGAPSATLQLESAICERLRTPHCLALNSGSAAQLVALWALDLEPGSEILVPAFSFASCFSSIAFAGHVPVLVEVDESLGMSAEDAAAKASDRTGGIMVAHMLGRPTDLAPLAALSAQLGFPLIEDAAQALGATLAGDAVGTLGTVGIFSLNPFKVITAGDGGLLTTADQAIYERAFALHDHGARPLRSGLPGTGAVMGLNLRINELGAAMADVQLTRLDAILRSCRAAAAELEATLDLPHGVRLAPTAPHGVGCGSAVVLTFDDADAAAATAVTIGTHPLDRSGKHYHAAIGQLADWAFPRTVPRPSDARLDTYRPGSMPQTADILRRTVALGVGVHDSYLGTGVGPDPARPVRQVGADLSETLARILERG